MVAGEFVVALLAVSGAAAVGTAFFEGAEATGFAAFGAAVPPLRVITNAMALMRTIATTMITGRAADFFFGGSAYAAAEDVERGASHAGIDVAAAAAATGAAAMTGDGFEGGGTNGFTTEFKYEA